MLPPRGRQRNDTRLAGWDDGFAAVNHEIPKYSVAEDKYAQGYLAGLHRQKRLKKYLNVVYDKGKNS
jgi:hypothetical protein